MGVGDGSMGVDGSRMRVWEWMGVGDGLGDYYNCQYDDY
jgi:hypothetical protein